MGKAKAIVLMSKRAAEMTGMREGDLSDGIRIQIFDSDKVLDSLVLDSQERKEDDPLTQALTRAARLGDWFVLVVISFPQVPEAQVPVARERINRLVQLIQKRAIELGKKDANRQLPSRVRIFGVYQGDSPPPYVMELQAVPASDFLENLYQILSTLTESMSLSQPPEKGAGRLRLSSRSSQNEVGTEREAPASAPPDERARSEEPGPSPQPDQQGSRLRLRIGGRQSQSAQRSASDASSSPSRSPLAAEADEGARVLVVSRDQIPTVVIRIPIQINQDGMPDVGSRHFRGLEGRLREELGRRRITIPPGSPILGVGAGSEAIFRVVTYQELDQVGGDVLFVIVADETTEREAAYALSRMGTKPQDAVTVVYAGSSPSFLSYVQSIGFRCEIVERGKIAEAAARAAANMLAGRIPDAARF